MCIRDRSSYNDLTTLPSSATSFGENWAVKVTPSDGTDTGATVQSQDISISDVDSDMDGVLDGDDAFPNDPNETTDSDSDGVGDNADQFPNDPNETTDSDSDGVGDNSDAFPNDPNETTDTDSDGVGDNSDVFWNDSTQWSDGDGDGYGDNPNGNTPDACPSYFGNSTVDRLGCIDDDGDGYSDPDEGWNVSQLSLIHI